MKTLVCKLFVFVSLVGVLGAGVAKGQITNAVDFKAPSSFFAGEATLPAGSYSARARVKSVQGQTTWASDVFDVQAGQT
jgi:hypothetical protein